MHFRNPIYLSTWSIHDLLDSQKLGLPEFPQLCLEYGFNGLEMNDSFMARLSPVEFDHLVNQIQRFNLGVNLAVTNDFTVSEPETRIQQSDYVRKYLKIAAEMSAGIVRIYAGGKSALARKIWQQRLCEPKQVSTLRAKSRLKQGMFRVLMHNRLQPVRQKINHYLFSQNTLTPAVFDRIVRQIEAVLPLAEANRIKLVIENHGGFSSKPESLLKIVNYFKSDHLGLCPDWGNFLPSQDRYAALSEMMPYAFSLHAKSYAFDESGEEKSIDFHRCLEIAQSAHFRGPMVIEFEGIGDSLQQSLRAKGLIEKYVF
ncbi:TIM barrel protein [candidate division KSB1 bacterium]|nr:TIM barrel protein [candidate division KSB1 bacterium]